MCNNQINNTKHIIVCTPIKSLTRIIRGTLDFEESADDELLEGVLCWWLIFFSTHSILDSCLSRRFTTRFNVLLISFNVFIIPELSLGTELARGVVGLFSETLKRLLGVSISCTHPTSAGFFITRERTVFRVFTTVFY